jgi:hypothetical protein
MNSETMNDDKIVLLFSSCSLSPLLEEKGKIDQLVLASLLKALEAQKDLLNELELGVAIRQLVNYFDVGNIKNRLQSSPLLSREFIR